MQPEAITLPEARIVAQLRERYAQVAKANPTQAQQLRQTLDQKALLEQQLNSQSESWRKAYGLL